MIEMPEPWQYLRDDTPGTEEYAHFNNAGAALMPSPVIESMKNYIDTEARMGGYEAARFAVPQIEAVYEAIANLVGARPGNIALTANATDAYARALSSIPFEKGDVVIGSWSEYASNQIQFLSLAKRFDLRLMRAPRLPDGEIDLDALKNLIEAHRPKLVAAVHMNTASGFIENVQAIGALCRRYEALYLVDACQTVGQMPIDVGMINCDFLSATSRKFLRGPRGAGFLYLSDRVLDAGFEPLFPDLRGAKLIDKDHYRPAPDAKRFEDWEFSYAAILGMGEAARYALAIGLDDIETRLAEINAELRQQLSSLPGWRILDAGARLGPIIPLYLEGGDGAAIHEGLTARGVNTNLTPADWAPMDEALGKAGWALRVSPHYYTTPGDIDRLLQGLEEVR